uniref:Uncharacterized protein n=1 Tax=Anguilla anguilla TaxID=7936 RepID=A0A0E9UU44_ANGAN
MLSSDSRIACHFLIDLIIIIILPLHSLSTFLKVKVLYSDEGETHVNHHNVQLPPG